MVISMGCFVLFALLSYLWQPTVFVAMTAMAVFVVLFGITFQNKYKVAKQNFNKQLQNGMLTNFQVKQMKFNLKQLAFQFVLLYILAGAIMIFVLNQFQSAIL